MKYTIADLPEWRFELVEMSANAYRGQAFLRESLWYERTGFDPDRVRQELVEAARRTVADAEWKKFKL